MANFCVATRMSPSDYKRLTLREFHAFVNAIDRRGPSIEDMF